MWMGGNPPLGYDVRDRKLVINENEAETVRSIYRRYLDLGSVRALGDDLHFDGVVSKRRSDRFGRETGGKAFARGALYLMLQNRIYRGEIVHKGMSYPGQHEAIVDLELWEQVQSLIQSNRVERDVGASFRDPSLLAGLVWDETGDRMTPSHANKKGTRYRYYVSQRLIAPKRQAGPSADGADRGGTRGGRRVPASDLEQAVEGRLLAFLRDRSGLYDRFVSTIPDVAARSGIVERANAIANEWPSLKAADKRANCQKLIDRITVQPDAIAIAVRYAGVLSLASPAAVPAPKPPSANPEPRDEVDILLTAPAIKKRAGVETRLIVDAASARRREQDRSLLRMLGQAWSFRDKIQSAHEERSVADMAAEVGVTTTYFTRVLKLSFLAPEITGAILDERHPAEWTARRLSLDTRLPLAWAEQSRMLGSG